MVNTYYLVVYTDEQSKWMIEPYIGNSNIKMVIKPFESFVGYAYKEKWIINHARNDLLNTRVDWKVNMMWCEKVHFVRETMEQLYFKTDWYGWCDIGYFRYRTCLADWPNGSIIASLDKEKLHYACVNHNDEEIQNLKVIIDSGGIIPVTQCSIAGGFFMAHASRVHSWAEEFDATLRSYWERNRLVLDDQMIIADCLLTHPEKCVLYTECNPSYDYWFQFQRVLA